VADADSRAALIAGLREHGLEAGLAERLAAYGALLLEANRRVNLTGAKEAAAVLPHLLDALTLVPFVRLGASLVDVGSGGGLPGIPLAIATGVRVTLVEPIAKKAAFLRDALAALDLAGEVAAERAEVSARDPRRREQFDYATARAVSRAPTVAELTLPFLRIGGRALLQRGSLDARERRAVEDAAPVLGGAVIDEVRLAGEQRVLVLEKQRPSSERFPRRNGVPEKRPLCWDEPPAERERST
jgi:16S rRNA (guanine527-N7)-methyltransferase